MRPVNSSAGAVRASTGGVSALPIWIGYMSKALKDVPEHAPVVPEGVVSARVGESGARSGDDRDLSVEAEQRQRVELLVARHVPRLFVRGCCDSMDP